MNVLIFEASHGECDVTQFSQLNLNSSFFQWFIICRFIYINLQKWKQLLNVGLLCNIKVIEDTTRNSVTLFRRKFCLIVPVICKSFLSRERDVHVHSPPIYGRNVKWRETINEMGGIFQVGIFWVEIFQRRVFQGRVFLVGFSRG